MLGDKVSEFIHGTLQVRIKEDVSGYRIFNKADLLGAAYYHSRRFFLTLPGWQLRVNPDIGGKKPDLAVFQNNQPKAFMHFECSLVPKQPRYFPMTLFNEKIIVLKNLANQFKGVKGWLFGVYDTDDNILLPTLRDKDAQLLIWIPINVRELHGYAIWRKKWDELKPALF